MSGWKAKYTRPKCCQDRVLTLAAQRAVKRYSNDQEMSLEYVDWDDGDVAVITLSGRITLGQGTEKLREAVQEVMRRGRTKVLLNFDDVLYMDSTGLGELVAARRRVMDAGGQLKLMKLKRVARNLMQITQLYTVFEIFVDEASALASFNEP